MILQRRIAEKGVWLSFCVPVDLRRCSKVEGGATAMSVFIFADELMEPPCLSHVPDSSRDDAGRSNRWKQGRVDGDRIEASRMADEAHPRMLSWFDY
jgi:hypothetical protein